MKELRTIARASVIFIIGLLFGKFLGLLFRIIVARIGVEEYGLYNLGLTVLASGMMLSSMGLGTGVLRYVAHYAALKKLKESSEAFTTAVKLSLYASIIVAFVIYLFSDFISLSVFNNSRLSPVLKILSIALPFMVTTDIFFAATDALKQAIYRIVGSNIILTIIKTGLAAVLIYLGFGLHGALIAYLISVIVLFFYAFFAVKRLMKLSFASIYEKLHMDLLKFSWPLLATKFSDLIMQYIDTFLLGVILSAVSVGIYHAATPAIILMSIAPAAFMQIFLPTLSGLLARSKSVNHVMREVTWWITAANAPVAFFLAFNAKEVLSFVFGQQYTEAATAMIILALAQLFSSMLRPGGTLLPAFKKTKYMLFISLIAAAANLGLNILLIPKYGVNGAAIASATATLIQALIYIYLMKKYINFWLSDKRVYIGLACALAVFFTVNKLFSMAFKPGGLYWLAAVGVSGFALYGLLLLAFRTVTLKQIKGVLEIAKGSGSHLRKGLKNNEKAVD